MSVDMSLRMKISIAVIIAGAVLFLFGLILIFTGDPKSYFDLKSYEETAQSSDISSVIINIGYGNVSISTGTSFKLSCENAAEELFEYGIANNVLTVSYDADYIEQVYFGMGDGVDTVFDIVLPNKLLEEVEIALGKGQLSVRGVSCNEFLCTASGGDISLSGITVNHGAKIQGGSGDCELTSCTMSGVQLIGGSGSMTATKSRFADLRYDGGFGSLKLAGCNLSGESRLESGFADVSILLPGSAGDYGFSFDKGRGSITVDGSESYRDYDDTASEGNNLFVKNGFGDVAISFASSD